MAGSRKGCDYFTRGSEGQPGANKDIKGLQGSNRVTCDLKGPQKFFPEMQHVTHRNPRKEGTVIEENQEMRGLLVKRSFHYSSVEVKGREDNAKESAKVLQSPAPR